MIKSPGTTLIVMLPTITCALKHVKAIAVRQSYEVNLIVILCQFEGFLKKRAGENPS